MKKINKGFTLIELLVVIGIIAILTGLITFNFNSSRARARDVQRKNDLKAVQQALELYRAGAGNQVFPDSTGWALTGWGDKNNLGTPGLMPTLFQAGAITQNFFDPKETLTAKSWVQYSYTGIGLTYTMKACLENRSDNDAKDSSGVVTNCGPGGLGVYYTVNNP